MGSKQKKQDEKQKKLSGNEIPPFNYSQNFIQNQPYNPNYTSSSFPPPNPTLNRTYIASTPLDPRYEVPPPNILPKPNSSQYQFQPNPNYVPLIQQSSVSQKSNINQPAPTYQVNYPQMTTAQLQQSQLYKELHSAREYNVSWLDVPTQTLRLTPSDTPLLHYWTKNSFRLKNSLIDQIKNVFMLFIYVSIYALIMFFWKDRGTGQFNQATQAFFFPLLPYILLSYRSLDKYFKSLFSSLIVLLLVYYLTNQNFINATGNPFLKYFIFIFQILPQAQNIVISTLDIHSAMQLTLMVIVVVYILEFLLLILHWSFSRRKYIEMVVTRESVFVRAKSSKSVGEFIKLFFYVIIAPFNIKQYVDIWQRIRYNKMTTAEGRWFDFSKIPINAILKVKKRKNNIILGICISILLPILGFLITPILAIPIGLFCLVIFIKAIRSRGTYRVELHLKRSKVEGSWILNHTSDIIIFNKTPPVIAQFFRPI